MAFNIRLAKSFAIALLVFAAGNALGQSDPVDALYAELQNALGNVSPANTKLEAHYLDALRKLHDATAKSGDPERAGLVREEIAGYRTPGERDFADFPALALLRGAYEESSAEIAKDLAKSRLAVLKIYEERFSMMKESLTAEGNVSEAVKANRHLEAVTRTIADPTDLSELTALWVWRGADDVELVNEAILDRKSGKFLISSKRRGGGSYIKTKPSFVAPYEISTRMTTDSVNIRFYLNSRVVAIFNWEMNRKELRLHDPTNVIKQRGIKGAGYVKENEMHEIKIYVRDDKISICANGEVRGEIEGDFSTMKGQVGIGPAFGSTLAVERFEILPLSD